MYLYLVTFNDQFCVEALASKRRWFQLPLDSTDKSIVVTQATVESRGASTSSCHGSSSYRSARSSVTSGSLGNKSTETDDDSGHLLSTSTGDDAGGEQPSIHSVVSSVRHYFCVFYPVFITCIRDNSMGMCVHAFVITLLCMWCVHARL